MKPKRMLLVFAVLAMVAYADGVETYTRADCGPLGIFQATPGIADPAVSGPLQSVAYVDCTQAGGSTGWAKAEAQAEDGALFVKAQVSSSTDPITAEARAYYTDRLMISGAPEGAYLTLAFQLLTEVMQCPVCSSEFLFALLGADHTARLPVGSFQESTLPGLYERTYQDLYAIPILMDRPVEYEAKLIAYGGLQGGYTKIDARLLSMDIVDSAGHHVDGAYIVATPEPETVLLLILMLSVLCALALYLKPTRRGSAL